VDIQDETGSTPLIWASSKGASNAIVKLIESGSEIQQSNSNGNTVG
jgi:ankyrin repeat protein